MNTTLMKWILFIFLLIQPAFADEELKAPDFFTLTDPKPTPTAEFYNEKEEKINVSHFKNKIILLNIWAKTCSRCMVEMPMLDRLQATMGSMKFEVVAVSSSLETIPAIRKLYHQKGIKNLKIYSDSQAKFATAADVRGLPTTLLINEDGMEIGRIRGIMEWESPALKAQIRSLIKQSKEKKKLAEQQSFQKSEEVQTDFSQSSGPEKSINVKAWFK